MTEVLIVKNIAGHRAGQVVEMTERLRKHVDAGNATILSSSDEVEAQPAGLSLAPPVEPSYSYNGITVDADEDDLDDDTED